MATPLQKAELQTLKQRKTIADLSFLYAILNGFAQSAELFFECPFYSPTYRIRHYNIFKNMIRHIMNLFNDTLRDKNDFNCSQVVFQNLILN